MGRAAQLRGNCEDITAIEDHMDCTTPPTLPTPTLTKNAISLCVCVVSPKLTLPVLCCCYEKLQ